MTEQLNIMKILITVIIIIVRIKIIINNNTVMIIKVKVGNIKFSTKLLHGELNHKIFLT